jgi:cytochrome c biogenesis protein CcdA/thiol-disulfide isomerase/thioredoxin
VLGAGVTGGRRRPLGVVTGLVASFTFATVALVYVIDALGLPDDLVRWLAIGTLFVFGVVLLVPALADRVEAWVSRLAPGPARSRGEGFGSGFILGLSLGLVYAPCAGPILAGVIPVSASQDFTAGKLAVALSYAIGSGLVLYALMLGGLRLVDRMQPWRGQVQAAMGALLVATAVAMSADLDIRFQTAIADELPSFLVNPTEAIEESGAVSEQLADVRGGHGAEEGGVEEAESGVELPRLGLAPDFVATQEWFNTPDGAPLSIGELTADGRVVLIDFWTYTCINCIRTLPYLKAWDEEYRRDGLEIVGVHSPEFAFEKDASNVADAIADNEIRYPVVQDNELGTWSAFGNQYWPAKYLIGVDGQVRFVHFGEGAYEETEQAIRSLLAEAGDSELGSEARAQTERIDPGLGTPETYLGFARAKGWVEPPQPGTSDYASVPAEELGLNEFAYSGRWRVDEESGTAVSDAAISLSFQARRVFLVLGSEDGPANVAVELDGEPIAADVAGDAVSGGVVRVSGQRLYRLVELPEAGRHTLTLRFDPGVAGYAFTFG